MRLALLAALLATLVLPGAGSADTTQITATCNGAPCSTGWYTTDVHLSFTLPAGSSNPQNCGDRDITQDTAGVTITCTVAVSGSQCCRLDVTLKRDATPPTADSVALARGPDSNGWYNHAVAVTTSGTDALSGIASCTSVTYSGPDSGSATVSGTCTDAAGNVSTPKSVTFPYDATPPSVSAAAARPPDSNGWYNHPVTIAFTGTDGVSGVDSCTSTTYSGPDDGGASVGGSCRDRAGNVAQASSSLRYDATPPSVTAATPDRPPDANGWYNHAVTVTFAGSDAASGIASCDAPSYDKPNSPHAAVDGSCRDAAGNVSAPGTFGFQYDSTPPTVGSVLVTALDKSVALTWKASADVASLKIVRTRAGGQSVTVYDGKRTTSFTDRSVRNGDRYAYAVEAFDQAGNEAVAKTSATPAAPLVAPRAEAHVSGGVTFRWRKAPRATYYNLQLWRGGKKILSVWPAGPSYRIPRLTPGRYVWIVWPGLGQRSRHAYGPQVGKSTFVVTRRR